MPSSDDDSPEQFQIVEQKGFAFWQNWLACINQHLQAGGKPVAVILSLGLISVPLMVLSGSIWVAPILATSASIVAIRACWM